MMKEKMLSDQFNQLVLVPKQILEDIQDSQQRIIDQINNISVTKLPEGTIAGKYITEEEAKKMLDKGTTWFWQQRKAGVLTCRKIGNKNYYALSDLELLFENPEGGIADEEK